MGVPFQLDEFLRPSYSGSFFGLLRPFALLSGVVSLSMLVLHGAVWLHWRTVDPIASRARTAATYAGLVMIVAFAAAGLWLASGMDGYRITAMPDPGALPNPLAKSVEVVNGAWLSNYGAYPWMMAAPVLGFAGAALAILFVRLGASALAFIASSLGMSGVILTAGFSMFPFVMPSSSHPASSLTLWDAASSHLTLTVMFWAAVIFVPIILAYTVWTYRAMWGKVTVEQIRAHYHESY
jgi:cytochrome d ubiquinol oxidase subunit II